MKLKELLLGTAVAIASLAALTSAANAQTVSGTDEPTVLETIDDIIYGDSGDYYENRSLQRQVVHLFGVGVPGRNGFPELEIERDAQSLNAAYHELLFLQGQNTATIRVPDLANPYNTSVLLLPASQGRSQVLGTELDFTPLPRR